MKSSRFYSRSWLAAGLVVSAGALGLVSAAGLTHASVVADWNANTLGTGALSAGNTWTDSVSGISASAAGTGLSVNNTAGQFNGHNYITFGGSGNFVVPSGSVAQPISNFSITVVFDTTTANGSGDFPGNSDWYDANGLVGNEQPGIANDWGFGVAGTSSNTSGGLVFGEGNTTVNQDQQVRANYTYTGGNTIIATATRDASTGAVVIYINGVAVSQQYEPAGVTSMATTDRLTSTFLIGAMDNYTNTDRYFNGNIAEVQIDNSVVNADTVYNSLAPTYALPQASVPEPASLGLCAVGALGLLLLKRRKMA